MAPIQIEKSYNVNISSTPAAKCSRHARSSNSSWDVFLPITRRGRFFQDSYFSDIHKDFDSSVREVLGRWSDEDVKLKDFRRDDIMDRYRQLRSRNLKEENQAVTVTSDNKSHKIVLDVHDFMSGDVNVKVLDEEELLVEGRVEKKEGSSSVSTHSFRRYFSLPKQTDMAAISSVMSADGILTITAPKINTKTTNEDVINQTSASDYRGNVSETQKQKTANGESETTQSNLRTDWEHSSSTQKESYSSDFGSARASDSSRLHRGSWDTFVPITRRGGFFQDSFFSGNHRDFDASIRKVLNGWNDTDLELADLWDDDDFHRSDRLGRYRQLRSRNLWNDNQAVTVTSDKISYKIVLDMHDFMDGDVKVKLVGEKEVLVEGRSAMSSSTFRRSFPLPEFTDVKSITSVMSSDGILTITASKMESEKQQETTVIPVCVKEAQTASALHSSTSSTTSDVPEDTISAQEMSHTVQKEERKCTRRYQENSNENKSTQRTNINIPIKSVGSLDSTMSNANAFDCERQMEFNETISRNTEPSDTKASARIDLDSLRISNELEAMKTIRKSQDDSMPITRRGSFLQDSFFSDIRQDFDASIREVLKKWNDSELRLTDDVSHSDILSRYRQLRSRDMREENQAFSVSSDSDSLKIVLDVHDFMHGDVKVKVVDERELVVEGRVEKKEEGSSSVSSQSFRRRFSLPHRTDMTCITSVISSDGILTITAPKMVGEPQQNTHVSFSVAEERNESTKLQASTPEAVSSTTEKNVSVHENLVNVDQKEAECERKHTYEKKTRELKKEFEFPVESKEVFKSKIYRNQSVDESATVSTHRQSNGARTQEMDETLESKINEMTSFDDSFSAHEEQISSKRSVSESVEDAKLHEEVLPITRKGSFIQDSYFFDVRQEFNTAIREVLRKWSGTDSKSTDSEDVLSLNYSDILDRYRQLRSRELKDETQVSIVTSDNTSYKIVLDAQDFMNGDLKVKVVGETEVVVEGRVEKREEGRSSVSSHSFRRCFSLPKHVDMTTITSVMSSDGILTIVASKMEEPDEHEEISSIKVEEVQESSEVQRSAFPTEETLLLQADMRTCQKECERANKATFECDNSETEHLGVEVEDVSNTVVSEEMKTKTTQKFLLSTDSTSMSSYNTDIDLKTEEEKEMIDLKDSQESVEILDLEDSQENVKILEEEESKDVQILDLKDSQESVDIVEEEDSHEDVQILDLKDSQESVDIVDLTDSQETVEILDLKDSQETAEILNEEDSQKFVEILDLKDTQETAEILNEEDSQESVKILNLKDSQETAESLDQEISQEVVEILNLKDSQETNEILDLKDSQERIEILDLKDSQEAVEILDQKKSHGPVEILDKEVSKTAVEILDQEESQEAVGVVDEEDSQEPVEIPDLKDSEETVEILDLKSDETLNHESTSTSVGDDNIQNTSEVKSSIIFEDITEDTMSRQERSKPVEEEYTRLSLQKECENESTEVNVKSPVIIEKALDGKMNQLEATEANESTCTYNKEDIDILKPNKLKDTTKTVKYNTTTDTKHETSSSTSREHPCAQAEVTETVESLKGTSRIQRDSPEEVLLITKRGNFFQDSFFFDSHRDFSAALREVLDKCNEIDFKDDINIRYTDILEHYRQLRSRDLKEENQAFIVTSDKATLKIIVDVQDFMSGDVTAKVVDEELVIEGRVERREEGCSSVSSHSFRRRFSLPQYTNITSVMSLDGILTVTVTLKEGSIEFKSTENSVKTAEKGNITKEVTDSESPSLFAKKRLFETKVENQDGLRENVESQSKETRNISGDFASGVEMSKLASTYQDTNGLTRVGRDYGSESQETNRYNVTQDTNMGTSSCFTSVSQSISAGKTFPITMKGHFFYDSFFRDTRDDFQKAIKEVLRKWGEKSTHGDELTCYRKLRARNMREDNQAATSSEDERHYKFIIDVQDFMDVGEISVKAVSERELVVEGRLEKKDDGSQSTKRFLRRFVVPGDIRLEAVTSAMSSDGVLTISAPKKEGRDRKHVSADLEDMSDADATFSMRLRNGHRSAGDYLVQRDSSSDDEEFGAFARHLDNRYRVTFRDEDEELEDGVMFNKETKMQRDNDKDFKYGIPSFSTQTRFLHVDRKGAFGEDYFFASLRHSYSQAVREVLEKANEWTCLSDAMHNYRRLRQRNLKLENQAVSVLDDQDSHKIVMDVFDFIGGDVTVQLVKGKELLVEGQAEKQDGSRVSRVSFVRRFALPDLVERDAISCVLSSDGILTIISKKRSYGLRAGARGLSSERKSHVDTAGRWEDKHVKDSLTDFEVPSSRTFSTGSRSRYHRSYAKQN
ncbi:uncharacterized protein LOC122264926 isoform X2 [Penaeus japonicus]|uniref:uncharacterized protein LOC122264926 isoform X2 n=1 Tax=Penaeus japonicus TaxID=27405 RepID=UPI001C70E682|nr:uncharacterized protein LOC122264926 isoform X2 [Penaeus japonicus]